MPREVRGVGKWGEDQAVGFLGRNGFEIVERNYNSRVGEIDIVAKKGDDFYFVEVKTRAKGPLEYDLAVTAQKKRKFIKAVREYCTKRSLRNVGLIIASLMVVFDRKSKVVNFRMAVLY